MPSSPMQPIVTVVVVQYNTAVKGKANWRRRRRKKKIIIIKQPAASDLSWMSGRPAAGALHDGGGGEQLPELNG